MLAYAKEESIELTDEQLTFVSGGGCSSVVQFCRCCGSDNICLTPHRAGADTGKTLYYCRDCQTYFFYESD